MKKINVISISAAALIAAADQYTKHLAVNNLDGEKVVIDGVLSFDNVKNTGAAWGMLENGRAFFIVLTLAVLVGGGVYLARNKVHPLAKLAFAFIGAGAIGNLIDRVRLGYVRDFIRATFIDFPVFNVADCAICVGAALLIIYLVFIDGKRDKSDGKDNA